MRNLRNITDAESTANAPRASPTRTPFDPVNDLRLEIERRFSTYNEELMTDSPDLVETIVHNLSRALGIVFPIVVVGLLAIMLGGGS